MVNMVRIGPTTAQDDPQIEAARQQIALALQTQQEANRGVAGVPLASGAGAVQAKYGMGNALVDLANRLAAGYAVGQANKNYQGMRDKQDARIEGNNQAMLDAVAPATAGSQKPTPITLDSLSSPAPTPGFAAPDLSQGQQPGAPTPLAPQPADPAVTMNEQTAVPMQQSAARQMIASAMAGMDARSRGATLSSILLQRALPKPAEPFTLNAGGTRYDEKGNVIAANPKEAPTYEPDRTLVKIVDKSNPLGYSTKLRKDFVPGVDNEYTPPNTAMLMKDSLSTDAKDLAAERYLLTGQLPSNMSRNPVGSADIVNRAAALAKERGDTAQSAALHTLAVKADQHAVDLLSKQGGAMSAAEDGANRQFDLALKQSKLVDRSGSPLINRAIVAWKSGVEGDPDTRNLVLALKGAQSQYAKVLQGAYGAAGITDTSARDAEALFNKVDSAKALESMLGPGGVARQEMANRTGGIETQRKMILERMGGSVTAPPAAPPPAAPPATDLAAAAKAELAKRRATHGT